MALLILSLACSSQNATPSAEVANPAPEIGAHWGATLAEGDPGFDTTSFTVFNDGGHQPTLVRKDVKNGGPSGVFSLYDGETSTIEDFWLAEAVDGKILVWWVPCPDGMKVYQESFLDSWRSQDGTTTAIEAVTASGVLNSETPVFITLMDTAGLLVNVRFQRSNEYSCSDAWVNVIGGG